MNGIKKGFITAGAAVGGIIGGTVSTAGKITRIKFLDELGYAIIDSSILTGTIAGQMVSGAADIAVGKIVKKNTVTTRGIKDLKSGGTKVFRNWLENLGNIVDNSGDVVDGVRERNPYKVMNGTKTLGKIAAVGLITVGAVKVENKSEKSTVRTEKSRAKEDKEEMTFAKRNKKPKAKQHIK